MISSGFDVSAAAIEAAGKAGITCVASTTGTAEGAEAVITMLPSGQHVRDVYLGPAGLIASARPGTLFIDSSTIDVDTARQVASAAAEAGMEFLDAPVSGVGGAAAGTLTFMVGGTRRASTGPSRCWKRWAARSSIAARPGPDRRRRSATT